MQLQSIFNLAIKIRSPLGQGIKVIANIKLLSLGDLISMPLAIFCTRLVVYKKSIKEQFVEENFVQKGILYNTAKKEKILREERMLYSFDESRDRNISK